MPVDGVPGYVSRLQLVNETTWGVPLASPTTGDRMEIVLIDRSGAAIRDLANKVVQRTAGGRNRPGKQKVGRRSVPFSFRTYLYESQAPALIAWGFVTAIPGGGTREALPSKTAYTFDGYNYRKFSGLRVDEMTITSEAGSDFVMITVSGVGKREVFDETDPENPVVWTSAIFPSAYAEPDGDCYIHQDAESHVSLAGTNMGDKCRSLTVRVRNANDHRHRGGKYISRNSMNGRDFTVGATPFSDDDTYYNMFRDQTPGQVIVGWYNEENASLVEFTSNNISYLDSQERSNAIELDVEETHLWSSHEVAGSAPDYTTNVVYDAP